MEHNYTTPGTGGEAAALRDRVIGALIGISRAASGNEHLLTKQITALVIEGLLETQAEGDPRTLQGLLTRADEAKRFMVPDCFTCAYPCGRTADCDMDALRKGEAGEMKLQLLEQLRGLAACAGRALEAGCLDLTVEDFLYQALFLMGEDLDEESLRPYAEELAAVTDHCNALLSGAEA